MTPAKSDGRALKKRAPRSARQETLPAAPSVDSFIPAAVDERPPVEAYLEAFRSVVTPERLRTMAVDLIADFNEQETPLKEKFAVWSRFAAYAIGTPQRQVETGEHGRAEEYLKALLDALETAPATDK